MEPTYNVFKVIFNPHLKKAQDKYQLLSESICSVTLGTDYKLYISFNEGIYQDVSMFELFMGYMSTINRIEIQIGDRNGTVVESKVFNGKFTEAMYTDFSYEQHLKFLTIFEINLKYNNE